METLTLIPYIYEHLITFILAFTRISALLSTFVVFRRDFINARILIIFSGILAIYAVFLYPQPKINFDIISLPMMVQILFQVLIGVLSGLILNIMFEIFMAFGQFASIQTGFSMVTLIDPRLGAITPLTLFYFYVAVLIFFQLNGHLILIKLMMNSFSALPVITYHLPDNLLLTLLKYSQIIFSGSLFLSITLLVTLLITNLTLAVMTRFAPQFNLFSIGINISIIIGLLCLYITFNLFVENSVSFMNEGVEFLQNFISGLKYHVR